MFDYDRKSFVEQFVGVVEILFMFPSVTGGLFFVGLTFFDVCGSRNTNAITIKSCDYSYCNI